MLFCGRQELVYEFYLMRKCACQFELSNCTTPKCAGRWWSNATDLLRIYKLNLCPMKHVYEYAVDNGTYGHKRWNFVGNRPQRHRERYATNDTSKTKKKNGMKRENKSMKIVNAGLWKKIVSKEPARNLLRVKRVWKFIEDPLNCQLEQDLRAGITFFFFLFSFFYFISSFVFGTRRCA